MNHKQIARDMPATQRDVLLHHFSGGAPVSAKIHRLRDWRLLEVLARRGLIKYDQPGRRPMTSSLTEDGRMVAAFLLGSYADALAAAGLASLDWRSALTATQERDTRPILPATEASQAAPGRENR